MKVYYICIYKATPPCHTKDMRYLKKIADVYNGRLAYSLTYNPSDAFYFECEIFARKMIDYMISKHFCDDVDDYNKPIYKFGVLTKQIDETSYTKQIFNHDVAVALGLSP